MRWVSSMCVVAWISALGRADAGEGDVPADARDDGVRSPSRALPIAMIALGAPALVTGTFGIAFDEAPSPERGPTIWKTGRPGVIAAASGAVFTAAGVYLYLKHAPVAPQTSRTWMKWTGIATLGVATIGAGLGVKYALDRRSDDRELYVLCMTDCTSDRYQALLEHRERVSGRASLLSGASAVAGVAGIALYLVSREGDDGPEIQVSSTSASLGWATSF